MENSTLYPLYKAQPPFMEYKKGYGYLGVILQDSVSGKIQCHLCGGLFKNVSKHLYHVHDISDYDYKEEVGLNNTTPLVCESTSQKMRENYLVKKDEVDKRLRRNNKKVYKEKMITSRHKKPARVQQHNLFGTCNLQAKELFWHEFNQLGKIPTNSEMSGSLRSIIYTRFKSYEEALISWGVDEKTLKKYKQSKLENVRKAREAHNFFPKYDKDIIIKQNREFYKQHKRLPTWEEGRRLGFPSRDVYVRCFGTKNKKELLTILL